MWIFLNDAFISAVQHRDDPNKLVVRARRREDLERTFPGAPISVSETSDYRYRVFVSKLQFAGVIAEKIAGINYPNFKNSVAEHDRHDHYARVWGVMHGFQERPKRRIRDREPSGIPG